jgi:hypothetical protein
MLININLRDLLVEYLLKAQAVITHGLLGGAIKTPS